MLISSTGQARLLNYINVLSQLPLQRFQELPEAPETIERYLGVVRREMATLLPPLGLKLQDLEVHLAEEGRFRSFFTHGQPDWLSVSEGTPGDMIIEDFQELHLSLYDTQQEYAEWNRLRRRSSEIPSKQVPSEALKVQLRRVEGAWSSRIRLAERAMELALSKDEDVAKRVIERALGAYCDKGMRLEFTVLTTLESMQHYLSG